MVGGIVIDTKVVPRKGVWINCQDYNFSDKKYRKETCAIYIEDSAAARSISEGDSNKIRACVRAKYNKLFN